MGREQGCPHAAWPHGFGVGMGMLLLPSHRVSLVPRFPLQQGGEAEESPCHETQDVSAAAAAVQASTGPLHGGDAFVPSTSFIFPFPGQSLGAAKPDVPGRPPGYPVPRGRSGPSR